MNWVVSESIYFPLAFSREPIGMKEQEIGVPGQTEESTSEDVIGGTAFLFEGRGIFVMWLNVKIN